MGGIPFAEILKKRADYTVSDVSVYKYEKEGGTEKVPAAYIAAVSVAFNLNPAWLLFGEEPRKRLPPSLERKAITEFQRIMRELTEDSGDRTP